MKLRRRQSQHAEVMSSPLNDIMFFLMLFFLIVSTLASPHVIKVLLPQANATQSAARRPLTLTVTEQKRYFIDEKEVAFADLEATLLKSVGNQADATIVIRPARALQIQDLVDVLEIGVKNNMRMVLATSKK